MNNQTNNLIINFPLNKQIPHSSIQILKMKLEKQYNIKFPDNYNIPFFTPESLAYTIKSLQREQKENE